MFNLTFDIDGIEELERAAAAGDEALTWGVKQAVADGAAVGEAEAKSNHPYQDRSTDLTNSIHGRVESTSATGAEAVLEATQPYASFVEGGTKPHTITAKDRDDAKGGTRPGLLKFEGRNGTVFVHSVNHPGTSPKPFMQPAAEVAAAAIRDEIESDVIPRVREILGG